MLTTIDNPYNPFTQFDDWYNYDEDAGYYTCAYLSRVVHTTSDMNDQEVDDEIDRAMNEIIACDPFGLYFKIKEGDTPSPNRL